MLIKATVFAAVFLLLSVMSCSNNAESKAFFDEKFGLASQLSSIVDKNPTETGIAEAQKEFDAKKDSMKVKWDKLKASSKSGDLAAWYKAEKADVDTISAVRDRHTELQQQPLSDKFYALINSWEKTFDDN